MKDELYLGIELIWAFRALQRAHPGKGVVPTTVPEQMVRIAAALGACRLFGSRVPAALNGSLPASWAEVAARGMKRFILNPAQRLLEARDFNWEMPVLEARMKAEAVLFAVEEALEANPDHFDAPGFELRFWVEDVDARVSQFDARLRAWEPELRQMRGLPLFQKWKKQYTGAKLPWWILVGL